MHPLMRIEGIHIHQPGIRRHSAAQLIGDFMPRVGTGLLIGDSGIGKTFTALAMATALATGKRFFDKWPIAEKNGSARPNRNECGATLFVLSEGHEFFPKRIDASYYALEPNERARLVEQGFSGLPIFQMDGGNWHDEAIYQSSKERIIALATALSEMYENVCLELIVIDTVSGVFLAPAENDAAITQRTMENMRKLSKETGAFVLGITHPAKGKAKSEPRGSVVFGATADLTITAQYIARSRTRAGIYISKNRDGPGQREKTEYSLVAIPLPNGETSMVATAVHNGARLETELEPSQNRTSKYDRFVLEACDIAFVSGLATCLEQGRDIVEAIPKDAVQKLAIEAATEDGATQSTARSSVNRAIRQLLANRKLASATLGSVDFVFHRDVE